MKIKGLRFAAVIAAVLLIVVLLAACSAPPPAATATATPAPSQTPTPRPTFTPTATPRPTATATPTPRPSPTPTSAAGDVIPLKSLADLSSLSAAVKISVDGTLNGKPAQGDLVAQLTTNDQKESQIVVTGPLLGDVIVQVGGTAVNLFKPSQATIYQVPEGTYIVVKGLFDVCIKPKDSKATADLDQLSPQGLMMMLTDSDVARGKLAGNETLNGSAVKHYVIDGSAFLTAAQQSVDPNVRTFGQALRSAQDADLYVDSESGYPGAFRGSYSGAFEPLKFDGDFSVQIDLTDVNTNAPVNLPQACNNPISR
jgi:hypothetical protein